MFAKRDLGAEVAALEAASSSTGRLMATAKHKVPKLTSPEPDDMERIRESLDEAFHRELDPVIVIKASDQLCDEIVASKDAEMVNAIDKIPGNYHDAGFVMNDNPVWKSIEAKNGKPYYIFNNKEGWYIANVAFWSDKDRTQLKKADVDVDIIAWGSGDLLPRKLHVPYWAAKPCKGLTVQTLWDVAMSLADENQQLLELGASNSALTPRQPDEPPNFKGKGDNKGTMKHRGGWLPKMAQLITALWQDNMDYAHKLANRFCNESWMLNDLVQKKIEAAAAVDE